MWKLTVDHRQEPWGGWEIQYNLMLQTHENFPCARQEVKYKSPKNLGNSRTISSEMSYRNGDCVLNSHGWKKILEMSFFPYSISDYSLNSRDFLGLHLDCSRLPPYNNQIGVSNVVLFFHSTLKEITII